MPWQAELDCKDVVGESLVYDAQRDALVWVDIVGRRIHRLHLAGRHHETWATPDFPTSIGLRRDGGAVVGLLRDVALWDFGGPFQRLARPEPHLDGNRLNEGQVAPDGSYWVGTMQNNFDVDGRPVPMDRASGAVYRIAPNGEVTQLTPNDFGITNTMAWTDDGRFIIADSLQSTLYAYRLANGRLGERVVFFPPRGQGVPDGSALAADGALWNCRAIDGAVAEIANDGGLRRCLPVGVSSPTSCAFGGQSMDRLYVTSARFAMSAAHLAANPIEGSLISISPGARGRLPFRFG